MTNSLEENIHRKRKISSDLLIVFNLNKLPFLQYLDLSDCHGITDNDLLVIGRKYSTLKILKINSSHYITGIGLTEFVELAELHCMHCINLTNLNLIAFLRRFVFQLRYLDISYCSMITESAINFLYDMLLMQTHLTNGYQLHINMHGTAAKNISKTLAKSQFLHLTF